MPLTFLPFNKRGIAMVFAYKSTTFPDVGDPFSQARMPVGKAEFRGSAI